MNTITCTIRAVQSKFQFCVPFFVLMLLFWGDFANADTKVRVSSFEYGPTGMLTKEVVEPDSPNDCLQTTYAYHRNGNRSEVSVSACPGAWGQALQSAGSARTTRTTYDYWGMYPVETSNALGHTEQTVYSYAGITRLTGPNGLSTSWTYDAFERKTEELRADGTRTRWEYRLCSYSGVGCPATVGPAKVEWVVIERVLAANLVASAPEKRQYHDALNRVVRVETKGFDGSTVAAPTLYQDTEYNSLGQVARKSHVYASNATPEWMSYAYDDLGRQIRFTYPEPSNPYNGTATTSTSYNGLSTSVTNSLGQTRTTILNPQGTIASVTDANGVTITYAYDALGQLTQTNAAGSITKMQYNQRGQKIAMQDPAMGSWVYDYNAFGELVSQRNSLGQTTTQEYDVLGRMVRRTEPDLVSEWAYDVKFDATGCGLGKGKLCEARSNNGYKRTHTYDSLGRINTTATVLDNPTTPATVSVAYDNNTGRVASKTWPTGYQARYTYTAQGYLKSVSGGGSNGFSATHSYEVLAMNANGQITQYKTGNNVTTVSTYNSKSQRLVGQTVTTDGQSTGNVLKQSYNYDSLGNLLSRNDSSPGVGTQESFSYDRLNRLSTASLLGGAVTPPTTTEVLYDDRGNIAYKSDVGRYWYDPARPNRMTQVTLETAPGATVALTGTRALSYAFDDTYANVPSCLPGYTLSGNTCSISVASYQAQVYSWSCSNGFMIGGSNTSTSTTKTLSNPGCVLWRPAAPPVATSSGLSCSVNQNATLRFGQCYFFVTATSAAYLGKVCESGEVVYGQCQTRTTRTVPASVQSINGVTVGNGNLSYTVSRDATNNRHSVRYESYTSFNMPQTITYSNFNASVPSCLPGYTLSGDTCSISVVSYQAQVYSWSCPYGFVFGSSNSSTGTTVSDRNFGCVSWQLAAPPVATSSGLSCTVNQQATLRFGGCYRMVNATYATPTGRRCNAGTLVNGQCETRTTRTVPAGSSNASDRTLAFVYGPEHQRIRQSVSLSGNGTSSYFSGNTWYLNGEDSLGLTYEKEIRDNGTTEHKHYISVGGTTFALFVSRSGSLNNLPANSTSYFHKDQIGSISAITNESGVVVERLAYDPWGKRRFINITPGLSDNLDAIVGVRTERGYTEHEHLDEVGVIHMNGRIYDPLIGRFLSADVFIQAPENLQSHNRYSYVINNPLTMTDPSGHLWGWIIAVAAEVAHQAGFISKEEARTIQAIAIAFEMGQWGASVTKSNIAGGAIGGASGAFVASEGNLEATAKGALTGALFGWAGLQGKTADSFGRYAAHAAAGCVSAVADKRSCGSGAASAVIGKYATNLTSGRGFAMEFTATVVAGGVGSVIAGGKFENGATTAAYGYLFNELLKSGPGSMRRSGYETRDAASNMKIWSLDPGGTDPSIKLDVVTAFNNAEANGDEPLRIGQGYRTNAEQDALYAQGRTTPGPIVTWARGGQSIHNLGHAIDIFRIDGGKLYNVSPATVNAFKQQGFTWGGDWKPPKTDKPHFQR